MPTDLKDMTRKELVKLRTDIDKALERLDSEERKKALDAAERAARSHGYSLSELTGEKPKSRKSTGKAAPKYRNPADVSQTWTGRGRQPEWFKAALAAGTSPDELAI